MTSRSTAAEQRSPPVDSKGPGGPPCGSTRPSGARTPWCRPACCSPPTEELTVGTGIANIWARPAVTLHGGAAGLADAFPGRFVLGIGVGYAHQAELVGQEFTPAAPTMPPTSRRWPPRPGIPAPAAPYARILAANGPRLLELARDCADGALPAMRPSEFTAEVRDLLGPDKLLVAMVHLPADQT